MSTKDTDDVLDFIKSLPDSKSTTPVGKKKLTESSDDFMNFLDELTAHEKSSKPTGNSRGKFEPKKRLDPGSNTSSPKVVASEKNTSETERPSEIQSDNTLHETKENLQEPNITSSLAAEQGPDQHTPEVIKKESESAHADPIASLSSWWNSEGSQKVSSFWGSLSSNAHQLGETTFQLASNTSQQLSHQRHKFLSENGGGGPNTDQIVHITDKLNSILSTMSQQIKDGLIDKEDELLNILLVYDLNNINYLDTLCTSKFNKVMSQVEGGIKTTVSSFNHKHENTVSSRDVDLSMFYGKAIDGEKLCFANLDSSIKDYLKITRLDEQQQSSEDKSVHEVNKSNVFIAIQPISPGSNEPAPVSDGPTLIEANNANCFAFTMILRDITNNITIVSKSQPFPLRWARWLSGQHEDVDGVFSGGDEDVGQDAVDPREWVEDWVYDGLGLTFAVLAQEYVTKRMGI